MSENYDQEEGLALPTIAPSGDLSVPSEIERPPLTGAQRAVLAAARKGPLFAVGMGWRPKGGRASFRGATIESLLGRGFLSIEDGCAVITPAGRRESVD